MYSLSYSPQHNFIAALQTHAIFQLLAGLAVQVKG